ncbi:MAG TPA: response regulator [Pyrinomonadaceae bacterium]|nr:response regulator [Pyrinomonadaceae bacterium]
MSSTSGRNQTVMVVDDSDDVREVAALQLRMSGYDVIEARDGQEAVELARQNCPALIFMDIQMPGMDGLTATRLIRNIRELCAVTIIAFSAFGSGGNRERAIEAGCDDFVSKVAAVNQLPAIIERFLPPA